MNKSLNRVGKQHRVNPDKPVNFIFDGVKYQGAKGDTLASALLANGVKRFGRSFKLHRPRGLLAAGREEPNGLMQLEKGAFTEPNTRATLVPIYEGLTASGQNAWPNVNHDVLGILSYFHCLLPASFYYKSMMRPSWHFYEGVVRRLAGLGKTPISGDPQTYVKRNSYCDVLVVGAGPSGIAAALSASKAGFKVVLVDEQEELGGSLLGQIHDIGDLPPSEWLASHLSELRQTNNITILPRTCAIAYYEHNFVVAVERITNHLGPRIGDQQARERMWRIRARKVILATGAMERPLVFPNNDRPGIMLCSAVTQYATRYGVIVGNNIVVVTNNDSAYRNAFVLNELGANISAIVDCRSQVSISLESEAKSRNIKLIKNGVVSKIKGSREVKGLVVSEHLGDGQVGGVIESISCDTIAMAGGWTPSIHLYSQAGGDLDYNFDNSFFVPKECAQNTIVVGFANGTLDLESSIIEGSAAGETLESALSESHILKIKQYETDSDALLNIQPYWYLKNLQTDKQWIDFQYDVKVSDIELATRENFVSVEHLKRYTTNGMSIDQGKTSNINALAVMAELSGRQIPDVGTTKFRPPFHPATIGTLAGREVGKNFAPIAQMPAHEWHVSHGAHMEDMGWLRPEYYIQPGEDEDAAIRREVLAVRNNVGIFDGSPIGKIEVKGPDAGKFLNRIYINNAESLKVHKARYGLVINENGIVIDDGVFVRLADDHFLVHTTSGGVGRISQWMEEWLQCEWLDLDVIVNNVTTQWACVTVSGPNTRNVLAKLDSDIDFMDEEFKHMQFREGQISGLPARVLRASFTGEVSFEVSVPANYGLALWEAVYNAGAEFDITPYGVESLMMLRAEKGYLHIGADTDGTTNPLDLGWGVPISKKADDFIGRRSLSRENDQRADRLQFVGLEAIDPKAQLPIGGHIINEQAPNLPIKTQGYCTYGCLSPTLNKSIGLGLVADGMKRTGEQVYVYSNGSTVSAKIVSPSHYDPKGERLNG